MRRLLTTAMLLLVVPTAFLGMSVKHVTDATLRAENAPIVRVYDNANATVTYPILVLADNNATATTQATFTFDTANPDRIFVRASNLRYNGKGRIRLNNGTAKTWVTFNEGSTTCAEPEDYGCMAINAYPVVRFTASVPSDWKTGNDPWISGSNTFDLQMVVPGSPKVFVDNGHGYRVLWFDALESGDGYTGSTGVTQYWKNHGGDNVLSKTGSPLHMTDTIVWDDYSSTAWRSRGLGSHFENSSSIAAGSSYFKTASITDNQGNAVTATCADCHDQDGDDMSYQRIENEFIIETVRARGGTETQGQQVAAFIRSRDDDHTLSNGTTSVDPPGYPWCPMFQPGDSYVTGNRLSQTDYFYWIAGSCEVLDYDDESAARWRTLLTEWDVQDIDADFKLEDLPISWPLSGWHQWLPIDHPMDFASGSWSQIEPHLDDYFAASSYSQINTEGHHLNNQVATSHKIGQNGETVQQWGVYRTDFQRVTIMKVLERSFFYDGINFGRHSSIFGENQGTPSYSPGFLTRQSTQIFEVAPHVNSPTNASQGWEFSEVGDTRGQTTANHFWYLLPRIVNPGWDPAMSAQVPNDMQYNVSFFFDKTSAPYRFTAHLVDQLDMLWKVNGSGNRATSSNANSGLTRARGWTPNVMNVHAWGRSLWDDGGFTYMSSADQGRVINAVAQAWYDVISDYGPNYDDAIIDRGTKRYQWEPKGYDTPTTGPFGGAANEFYDTDNFYRWIDNANAVPSSDKTLLTNLAEMFEDVYGSAVDWGALVDDAPGPPPVTLSVTVPAGGESYTQGDNVTVQVSTSGTDSLLAFLQKGGVTVETAADSVVSALSFMWALAPDLAVGSDYRFGVSSASGGTVTAYSGLFTVNAYVPPASDSTDATMSELEHYNWSGACDFGVGNTIEAAGDFGIAQPNDNGCAWLRPLHEFTKVSVTFEDIDAPISASTGSLVMSAGTDSVSAMAAIDYSASPEEDSAYVRMSVRFEDDGPRRYVTRVPVQVDKFICGRLRFDAGTIYSEYSEECTGSYTALGSVAVGFTPTHTGVQANSRTGVAGAPVELTVYDIKREN